MNASDVLIQLLLGFVAGATGQFLRVIVGLKKTLDDASEHQQPLSAVLSVSRLMVSLCIGGVAGALTILTLTGFKIVPIDSNMFGKLVAIGYAGTDAIEGLMHKYLPASAGDNVGKTPTDLTTVALTTRALLANANLTTATTAVGTHPVDWTKHIGETVAANVFPKCKTELPGGQWKIDGNTPIADECTNNATDVARNINDAASWAAAHYQYSWAGVSPGDLKNLNVINDLIALVVKKLS